jgi:hypothetical protein
MTSPSTATHCRDSDRREGATSPSSVPGHYPLLQCVPAISSARLDQLIRGNDSGPLHDRPRCRPMFSRRGDRGVRHHARCGRTGVQTDTPPRLSRIERLDPWTTAVERHLPGEPDQALALLDGWTSRDLAELQITIHSALALMRDPSVRIFNRPPTGLRGRPVQVLQPGRAAPAADDGRAVRAVGRWPGAQARRHASHQQRGLGGRADSSGTPRRSDVFVFHFSDGQRLNQEDSLGH